jgi:hypothetical protein
MLSGGEILRAIATKNTLSRRQKYYTGFVDIDLSQPVGRQWTISIRPTEQNYFLWMGVVATQGLRAANGTAPTFNGNPTLGISYKVGGEQITLSPRPTVVATVTSPFLCQYFDRSEYILLYGSEQIQATLTQNYVSTTTQRFKLTLCGIEYSPKG